MQNSYYNANAAYESLLDNVIQNGVEFDDTKALFNCGFYIRNPLENLITDLHATSKYRAHLAKVLFNRAATQIKQYT